MNDTKKSIPIYHGRRWPVGITNAAKRLGVTPSHLRQVLCGLRSSKTLSDGYAALEEELRRGGF